VLGQMLAGGAGGCGAGKWVQGSFVECECGSLWVSRVGVSLAALMSRRTPPCVASATSRARFKASSRRVALSRETWVAARSSTSAYSSRECRIHHLKPRKLRSTLKVLKKSMASSVVLIFLTVMGGIRSLMAVTGLRPDTAMQSRLRVRLRGLATPCGQR
jgi:hypothetical protein